MFNRKNHTPHFIKMPAGIAHKLMYVSVLTFVISLAAASNVKADDNYITDDPTTWNITQSGTYCINVDNLNLTQPITINSSSEQIIDVTVDLNGKEITSNNTSIFSIHNGVLHLMNKGALSVSVNIDIAEEGQPQGGFEASQYTGDTNQIRINFSGAYSRIKPSAGEYYTILDDMDSNWLGDDNKLFSNQNIALKTVCGSTFGKYKLVAYFNPNEYTVTLDGDCAASSSDPDLMWNVYQTASAEQIWNNGTGVLAKITTSSKQRNDISSKAREAFRKQTGDIGANKVSFMKMALSVAKSTDQKYSEITDSFPKKAALNIPVPSDMRKSGKLYAYIYDNEGKLDMIGSVENASSATTSIPVNTNSFGYIMIAGKYLPEIGFSDMQKGKWYYEAVKYAVDNGIMSGYADPNGYDGTAVKFAPDDKCTREMVIRIIYNMEQSPAWSENTPFTDVPKGKWYSSAISWGYNKGIMVGISDNKYGRGKNISREQLMQALYNYAKYKGYDVSKRANMSSFADVNRVSTWATDAVSWSIAEGIISGSYKSSTGKYYIKGGNSASRAEAATMFMKFFQKYNP